MNFDENDEEIKTKSKMIAVTTLSVIGVIIVFIILGIFTIKSFFKSLDKHTYHVIEVNTNNKENIISLLRNENLKYCESIYKIEYERAFTGDIFSKMYCYDEDNISLSIYDEESKLVQYIQENGDIENR